MLLRNFCCTCCRKTPLNVINEETRLLPKNDTTKNEIEIGELYVFISASEELRKVLLEGYGHKTVKKIICGKSHCFILLSKMNLLKFINIFSLIFFIKKNKTVK